MASKRNTLICTVGTSLFGNLRRLTETAQSEPDRDALAAAYSDKDWLEVADQLTGLTPTEPLCGAEINSVEILVNSTDDEAIESVNLHLLHSDTTDGRASVEVLQSYFSLRGWQKVSHHVLEGLSAEDPRKFRTEGLRNLAKKCGELVRDAGGPEFCAINATGGYKAQIAIAVLIGQALGVPVYYKFESFKADVIISFPPMPVALDFSLWVRASGMFMALSGVNACEPWDDFRDDWDERFEPLVNRVSIDDRDWLELSPTGQIFHETFRQRFQQFKIGRLPPAADPERKRKPSMGGHGYEQAKVPIMNFLQKITDEVPYVRFCHTTYWNPDLSQKTQFRQSRHGVQGIFSDGSWCVKFNVETTADANAPTDSLSVVVADLNEWLYCRS